LGAPHGVGLVGYGYSGRTLHAPLISAAPGLRLVAVASSRPGPFGVDGSVPRAGFDALLADPAVEAVVIATPTAEHAAQVEQALAAGKHVVVEKPMAASVAEAVRLAAMAERAGLVLTVFHNRRWDADFLTVQRLVSEGTLGEVSYYEARWSRCRPDVRDRWRERAGPGAGVWFDLGSHLTDQAIRLFGAPAWVQADLGVQRRGGEAVDYMHVCLGFEGPLRVVLHGSSLAAGEEPRLIVHGSAGSYVKRGLDVQEEALKAGLAPGAAGWGEDPNPGRLTACRDGAFRVREAPSVRGDWTAFYAGFSEALDGGPPPVAAREAVEVMRVLEAGVKSAGLGRRVGIEEV
jgi:predicted dehydrogenase